MRTVRLTLLLSIAAAMSSCASTPSVVSIGNGHYEVLGSSLTTFAAAAQQKTELIVTASKYCSQLGKQVNFEGEQAVQGHAGSSGVDGSGGISGSNAALDQFTSGNVIFSCQ